MKFRHGGSEKKLSFGSYPQVTLRDARKMRDEARDLLAEGKDPALEKQREKLRAGALAENTFTSIANEYCRKRRRDGDRAWAPATAARCEYLLSLLDNSIGKMPIHEIEPIDALAAIRKIEKTGKAGKREAHLAIGQRGFSICRGHGATEIGSNEGSARCSDHADGHALRGSYRGQSGRRTLALH